MRPISAPTQPNKNSPPGALSSPHRASAGVKTLAMTAVMLLIFAGANVYASTPNHWVPSGGGTWNLNTNWSLGVIPTSAHDVDFPSVTSAATITLDAAQNCNSITFNPGALGSITLNTGTAGSSLTIAATTGVINSAANNTIGGNVTLSVAATTFNIASGTTLTVNGIISGVNGSITMGAGTGTLVLGGANTFGGAGKVVTISAGTVQVSTDGNMGNASNGITFGGGTLKFTAGVTISNTRTFTIGAGGGTIDCSTPAATVTTIQSVLATTANTLTKAGTGVLKVNSAASSYSGSIIVNAGTLDVVGNIQTLGTGTITVNSGGTFGSEIDNVVNNITLSGGTLAPANSSPRTYSSTVTLTPATSSTFMLANSLATGTGMSMILTGKVTGSGNVAVTAPTGGQTLTLKSTTNDFSGTVTINTANATLISQSTTNVGSTLGTASFSLGGGVLSIKDNGPGSSGNLAYGNACAITAPSTITVDRSTANTANTVQFSTLSIGAFTLTVNGANTYALQFTGAVSLSGSPTFSTANNLTLSGNISESVASSITKSGAATLTLSGANNYSGNTSISAGTVVAGSNTALGTTAGTTSITSGATLSLQGGITCAETITAVAGTGVGALGAILNISSNNTLSGNITMTGATSFGSTANMLTCTGNISGAFTLSKIGAGTLQLSGTNAQSATTVSAGTLIGTTNSIKGNLTCTGTTTFDQTIDATLGPSFNGTYSASAISGAGILNKINAGTITFGTNGSFTGTVNINGGAIQANNVQVLGNTTPVVNVNGGSYIYGISGGGSIPQILVLNGGTLAADVAFSVNATFSGQITLGATPSTISLTRTTANTPCHIILSKKITGIGELSVSSTVSGGVLSLSDVTLNDTDTTGTIHVNANAILQALGQNTLGSAASHPTIDLNGGTLQLRSDSNADFNANVLVSATSVIDLDNAAGGTSFSGNTLTLNNFTIGAGNPVLTIQDNDMDCQYTFKFLGTGTMNGPGTINCKTYNLSGPTTPLPMTFGVIGGGAYDLTCQGSIILTAANTFTGNLIIDNTSVFDSLNGINRPISGNCVLQNNASLAGGLTLNTGCYFLDDEGALGVPPASGRLGNASTLTINGGKYELIAKQNTTFIETIGTLALGTGQNNIVVTANSTTIGSGDAQLVAGTLTRGAGSFLNFTRKTSSSETSNLFLNNISDDTSMPYATVIDLPVNANPQPAHYTSAQGVVPVNLTSFVTVKSGNWGDPTIWNGNSVPKATDAATVRHAVVLANAAGVPTSYAVDVIAFDSTTNGATISGAAVAELRLSSGGIYAAPGSQPAIISANVYFGNPYGVVSAAVDASNFSAQGLVGNLNGKTITMTSGAAQGQTSTISTFNVATGAIALTTPFIVPPSPPVSPAVGDTFTINALAVEGTVYIESGCKVTLNGVVNGLAGMTKFGSGELVLAGGNTYSGTTSLVDGTLSIANDFALGTGPLAISKASTNSRSILTAYSAARTLANAVNILSDFELGADSDLTLSGNVSLLNSAKVVVPAGRKLIVSGVVSETGSSRALELGFTFIPPTTTIGNGTLRLMGNNSFSGGVTLTLGNLQVGHNNAMGTGSLGCPYNASGTRSIAAYGGPITAPNAVTMGSDLTIGGAADLTFAGAVTLKATNAGDFRAIALTNTGLTHFSGVISGTYQLRKTGSGSLKLSNSNTFGNGGAAGNALTVGGGTLIIANNGALGSGKMTIENPVVIQTDGTARTVTNALIMNSSFTIGGTNPIPANNDLIFSSSPNANTFSNSLGITITTLSLGTTTIAYNISGSNNTFTFTKDGPGSLVFQGADSYGCHTKINAGTLKLSGASGSITAASTNMTINIGGILAIDNTSSGNFARLSDTMTVILIGGKLQYTGTSSGYTTGAVTTGGSTTIFSASSLNGVSAAGLVGGSVTMTSGANAGQTRPITGFAPLGGQFTVSPAFGSNVNATDTFVLTELVGNIQLSGGTASSIDLTAGNSGGAFATANNFAAPAAGTFLNFTGSPITSPSSNLILLNQGAGLVSWASINGQRAAYNTGKGLVVSTAIPFVSVGNGSWSSNATWGKPAGGVAGVNYPGSADDVIVKHIVDVTGTQAASAVTFDTGGATPSLTGAGTLTVDSPGGGALYVTPGVTAATDIGTLSFGTHQCVVNVTTGATLNINVPVASQGFVVTNGAATGLLKVGSGLLVLDGANTYTGVTSILEGQLNIRKDTNLGGATGGVTLGGGILGATAGGTIPYVTSRPFTFSNDSTIDVASGVVFTVNAALPAGTNSNSLTKTGPGTLEVKVDNTNLTGARIINGGTLRVSSKYALGDKSAPVTIGAGTLEINGVTIQQNILMKNGSGLSATGTGSTGDATGTGDNTFQTLTVEPDAVVTLSAPLVTDTLRISHPVVDGKFVGGGGVSSVNVTGAGHVLMEASSTYAGTWKIPGVLDPQGVQSVTLEADSVDSLGVATNQLIFNSGKFAKQFGLTLPHPISLGGGTLGVINTTCNFTGAINVTAPSFISLNDINNSVKTASLTLSGVISSNMPLPSITNSGLTTNVATITTSTPHGIVLGMVVTVSAVTNTALNGTYTVSGVPNSTQFTYSKTNADIPSSSDTGTVTTPALTIPATANPGILTLNAANTITQGLVINSGTVLMNGNGRFWGDIYIGNGAAPGATLDINEGTVSGNVDRLGDSNNAHSATLTFNRGTLQFQGAQNVTHIEEIGAMFFTGGANAVKLFPASTVSGKGDLQISMAQIGRKVAGGATVNFLRNKSGTERANWFVTNGLLDDAVIPYIITTEAPSGPQPSVYKIAEGVIAQPTFRIPENPIGAVNGVNYSEYLGGYTSLPNFDLLTPAETGVRTNFAIAPRLADDYFSFKFTAYVNAPADDLYTFWTNSDDGSKLYIGTTQVVDNDGLHGGQDRSGQIGLKAGKHAITVTMFEYNGGEGLTVYWARQNGFGKTQIANGDLYTIPPAATPVITPNGGTFTLPSQSISISDPLQEGAEIFYTTDGSTPTINSTPYFVSGPGTITTNGTIVTVSSPVTVAMNDVVLAAGQYRTVAANATNQTTFSLTSAFTADLTIPTLYELGQPFQIFGNTTVKAVAYISQYNPSNIATATFVKTNTAARITQVIASGMGGTAVDVFFDRPVLAGTGTNGAEVLASYVFNPGGFNPTGAVLSADRLYVRLTVPGLTAGNNYSVSIPAGKEIQEDPTYTSYKVPATSVGGQSNHLGTLGLDFNVVTPINVTQLGAFDSGSDGFARAINVYIYDRNSSANPLTKVTFGAAGAGTITSSTTTVTGVGTSWLTQLAAGDTIGVAGQPPQTIFSVDSNTQVTTTGAGFSPALATATTYLVTKAGTEKLVEGSRFKPIAPAGTISSSGIDVTGVGTLFMTQMRVGDTIVVAGQSQTVAVITSDTALQTNVAFAPALPLSTPFTRQILLPAGFQGSIVADNYGPDEPNGNLGVNWFTAAMDGGNGQINFVGTGRYGNPGQFPTNADGNVQRYTAGTFQFKSQIASQPTYVPQNIAHDTFVFRYYPQGDGVNPNAISRDQYNNIGGGNTITDLTSSPIFPNSPTIRDLRTNFEGPTNITDSYGTRMRAFFYPPADGYYDFYIATDDYGQLLISSDDNPANKGLGAYINGWTASRNWIGGSAKYTTRNKLFAGKRYYVEALQKEGGGGDNIAVRGVLAGTGTVSQDPPIGGLQLSPFLDSTLSVPPKLVSVVASGAGAFANQVIATFDSAMNPNLTGGGALNPANYTILGGGITVINPLTLDATGKRVTLTTSPALTAGTQYTLVVDNAQNSFSTPISAQLSGTVTINGTVTVVGNGTIFKQELRTGDYIRVAGEDREVANISSNSVLTVKSAFVGNTGGQTARRVAGMDFKYFGTGTVTLENWQNITGTAVLNLTTASIFPNSPSGGAEPTSADAPNNAGDPPSSFGYRMSGFFIPPTTQNYEFFISSGDASELWVSTTGDTSDPANKAKICQVNGATGHLNWVTAAETAGAEYVWVDEQATTPGGGTANFASDGGDSWSWVTPGAAPLSPVPGPTQCHQSNDAGGGGEHQHYFYGASSKMATAASEILFCYVYLDPNSPPTEVMLQWNSDEEGWNHRAYWGSNSIGWGNDGTYSRQYMGPLPPTGQWVRLEVPVSFVGLAAHTCNGMAYTLSGGKAYWDKAGKFTTSQKSAAISLNANQKYYFEALQKAGTGADSLAIRAVVTGTPTANGDQPIQGIYLAPYIIAPKIIASPVNQSISTGGTATFTVSAIATYTSTPQRFTWYKNGVSLGAGFNSATLTLTNVPVSDHASTYYCVVSNLAGSAQSATATLSVYDTPVIEFATNTIVNDITTSGTDGDAAAVPTPIPGTYVIVTTAAPHNLLPGQIATVVLNTHTTLNTAGAVTITSVPTPTTFTYAKAVATAIAPSADTGTVNAAVFNQPEQNSSFHTYNIVVTCKPAPQRLVAMNYAVVSGNATAGSVDYDTINPGTLYFSPGVASQTLVLKVYGDTLYEDDETIVLALSSPFNSTLGQFSTFTYTIPNDDVVPTVQFASATSSGSELLTTVSIPVTLSTASGKTVTVSTADVLPRTATPGADYTFNPDDIIFSPGQTQQIIGFTVVNDGIPESPNEYLTLGLSNPVFANLGTPTSSISTSGLSGNVATITTIAAHNLIAGGLVTVTANTHTALNGTYTILSTPNSTTLTYAKTNGDITVTADTGTVAGGGPITHQFTILEPPQWAHAGIDGLWATANHWSPNTVPTAGSATGLLFPNVGGVYTANNNIAGTFILNQIQLSETNSALSNVISGNQLEFQGLGARIRQMGPAPYTISAPLNLVTDLTVDGLNGPGTGQVTLSGVLTGAGGVIKNGPNTYALTNGTLNYTGNTTITSGTLVVDGVMNAQSSTVSMAVGTTLRGVGTINRNVTNTGGLIYPGNTTTLQGAKGVLTVQKVDFNNFNATGAQLTIRASSPAPNAAIVADKIVVKASGAFGNLSKLNLNFDIKNGTSYTLPQDVPIFDYQPAADFVWVDNSGNLPTGAGLTGDEPWSWGNTAPLPPTGFTQWHQSSLNASVHQHYFDGATAMMPVGVNDYLFAYVYIPTGSVPNEIMLQWNDGGWGHRAYWGASNVIGWAPATSQGPIPSQRDQWIRLSVKATDVGLGTTSVKGIAFTLHGGKVFWGPAGKGQPDLPAGTFNSIVMNPAGGSGLSVIYKNSNNTVVNGATAPWKTMYLSVTNSNVTPVTIDSFTARSEGTGALLEWTCATEFENAGFNLWRRSVGDGDNAWTKINTAMIPGRMTTGESKTYRYFDWAASGDCEYRLEDISINQEHRYFGTLAGPVHVNNDLGEENVVSLDGLAAAIDGALTEVQSKRDKVLGTLFDKTLTEAQNEFSSGRPEPKVSATRAARVQSVLQQPVLKKIQATPRADTQAQVLVPATLPLADTRSHLITANSRSASAGVRYVSPVNGEVVKVVYSGSGVLFIPQSSLPAGYDATHITITRGGQPVQALSATQAGLALYAPGYSDEYTDKDVFFLKASPFTATDVAAVPPTPNLFGGVATNTSSATVSAEYTDVYYDWSLRPQDYTPWFSNKYLTSGTTQTFTLNVPNVASGVTSLNVNLWSFKGNLGPAIDHVLQVFVNGTPIGQSAWNADGQAVSLSMQVPAGVLVSGNNVIDLRTPSDPSNQVSLVHSISADYTKTLSGSSIVNTQAQQVYEVSGLPSSNLWVVNAANPNSPQLIGYQTQTQTQTQGYATYTARFEATATGTVLVIPTGSELQPQAIAVRRLQPVAAGWQYIAVGPSQFASTIQPLISARNAEGLPATFVDQESIFDYYSHGRYGPEGIRSAVRDVRPQYLLLVGRTTFNYRNYGGTNVDPLCPSFLIKTTFFWQTVSDPSFGDLGNGYSEVSVGRLPANTPADLSAMVTRTLAYKGLSASGWHAMAVADRVDPNVGDFAAEADSIVASAPEVSWNKAYLGVNYGTSPEVTEALRLAANGGADLLVYVGHGNSQALGIDSPHILDTTSVQNWTGNVVFLQTTCNGNYFCRDVQNGSSIAIQGMIQPQGGIAASISTSTFMQPDPAAEFADILIKQAGTAVPNASRWGDAVRRAQQWAAQKAGAGLQGFYGDLAKTECILGDPALPIFLPGVVPSSGNPPAGGGGSPYVIPAGGGGPNRAPVQVAFNVDKLNGKIGFSAPGHDSVVLFGKMTGLPRVLAGTVVNVDIGGATASFTLDSRNSGKVGKNTIRVGPSNRNDVRGVRVMLTGDFAAAWAAVGITNSTLSNSPVSLNVNLDFGGTHYQSPLDLKYSAKAGKSGRFKK